MMGMDVLSDVLKTVHHTSVIRCRGEVAAPWGVAVGEAVDRAYFYVVIRGGCYLEVDGIGKPIALVGGDVVMLPHGHAHTLRDSLDSPVEQFDKLLMDGRRCDEIHQTLRMGGDGPRAALISGEFRFENRGWHPFLAAMPRLIHLQTEGEITVPWLEATLRFLSAETGSGSPGSEVMVSRLTDVLFIQIVRASMMQHAAQGRECNSSILRAMVDPALSKAVRAIHLNPASPWTVAELAETAGMSRTAFSTRFTSIAGIPPLTYVTRWRLLKATELLSESDASLAEIAEQVGYESEAAFSKAFKREIGLPPGRFRQQMADRRGEEELLAALDDGAEHLRSSNAKF
jgi:AraC-like DNA-binding protein